ncbi:MAG: zf-TFIIB domain-containing protein [Thermoanaerobaculales bacterium]|jgi:Zn-finger nucleic acid-binding protein|nr:zf-TFIIB domain-containing protein [Thermoanaerobaculales bacterium]
MQCPKCESELQSNVIADIEVEECPSCKGIWFDKDELRRVKDKADADLNWMDFEIWRHPELFEVSEKPSPCPACGSEFVAIDYGQTGVEIDFCPSCRGVWLDAGEMEKIVAALSHELLSMSSSDYVKESLKEAREIVTGPDSIASEWKDFTTVLRMLQYRLLGENPRFGSALASFQAKTQF